MPRLDELQRGLAAALVRGTPAPEGVAGGAARRAAAALRAKRRRVAAQLMPGLRRALGREWRATFESHAEVYAPAGVLYHVDDAWVFAAAQRRAANPAIRAAAAHDSSQLRRRYARRPGGVADRITVRRRDGWARRALHVLRELVRRVGTPAHRRSLRGGTS